MASRGSRGCQAAVRLSWMVGRFEESGRGGLCNIYIYTPRTVANDSCLIFETFLSMFCVCVYFLFSCFSGFYAMQPPLFDVFEFEAACSVDVEILLSN